MNNAQVEFMNNLWLSGGVILVLLALFGYWIFVRIKADGKKVTHDGSLADNTAQHYKEIIQSQKQVIENLSASITFEQARGAEMLRAYQTFVENSIVNRLNHCEEQHKHCDARLTEAHQRIDIQNKQVVHLSNELTNLRSSLVTAAIGIQGGAAAGK